MRVFQGGVADGSFIRMAMATEKTRKDGCRPRVAQVGRAVRHVQAATRNKGVERDAFPQLSHLVVIP